MDPKITQSHVESWLPNLMYHSGPEGSTIVHEYQIFGDHLSMGTEFVGDHLSRGINFMGIVCPGGQKVGDWKSGDQMGFKTKCVAAYDKRIRTFSKKLHTFNSFTNQDLDKTEFCGVVHSLSRRAVANGAGSSGCGKKSRTFACNDYTTKTKN